MRVGNERVATGEGAEKIEERHAQELAEQVTERRRDTFEAAALQLTHARRLFAVVPAHPTRVIGTGKATLELERARFTEEAIEHRMREGRGRAVLSTPPDTERFESLSIEEPSRRGLGVSVDAAHSDLLKELDHHAVREQRQG